MSSSEIRPGDPRYAQLLRKRFNKRFDGRPGAFVVVRSAKDVARALEDAVARGLHVSVQSGGHCLEGFVSDPSVSVVIDTSLLTAVYHDEKMGALAVEAGATLGDAWRKLFLGWGVMLPAGQSPDIGVGGHVLGGGFGFFHRRYGLAVDHLYGVEVVVIDEAGKARIVTATRDASDPHRDLWWAHTGCGGGNFGVVTRYYFRSPDIGGIRTETLLPEAPSAVSTFKAAWDAKSLSEASFGALVRNFGEWCERNDAADAPAARLFSVLVANRPALGDLVVRGVVTHAPGPDTKALIDEHLTALGMDVGPPKSRDVQDHAWLDFALNPLPDLFATGPGGVSAGQVRLKAKDALLRKRHTDRQIATAHDYLARRDLDVPGGALGLATYGGRVNTVPPDATSYAQRSSVMVTSYNVGWGKAEDDAKSLDWVRRFYADMFADSGGVPAPGDRTEGALINHPDADLADPAWNRSGVPFGTIYYKDNYPRLQQLKERWDPRNVFRHALSIGPRRG